jgi:hypothetical protein
MYYTLFQRLKEEVIVGFNDVNMENEVIIFLILLNKY